jgi:hypothetical protein
MTLPYGDDQPGVDDWADTDGAVHGGVDDSTPAAPESAERRSAATVLVELAQATYNLGVTADGEPYAVKPGHHVVRMLRGGKASLRAELSATYFTAHGKAAPQQALADALLVVEGTCQATESVEAHLRIAEHHGAVYLDLGDTEERVVRLDGAGWSVLTEGVPVRFRRTKLTGGLPVPVPGGDLSELWPLVNVAVGDRALVLAWLVAALLCPTIPHPALGVFGEQGTGKSTASRTLVSLVDPSPVPLRKPPRDADSWVTAAAGSWVVGLDNMSTIPDWLSDSLCRACTGDGDVRRALYTDGGLAVFAFRRVILLNGIDVGSLRGDLAERTMAISLDRITERRRRTESELDAQWHQLHPHLFGALLDLAASVKAVSSTLRLESSPRMADFALVLAAVDKVLGTTGIARYAEQATTMATDSLDSEPFLVALQTALPAEFEGTGAELLVAVKPAEDDWRAPRGWPSGGRQVTTLLRRNAPALRSARWMVTDLGKDNKGHAIRWLLRRPEITRISTSPCSPSSSVQVNALSGGEVEPDAYLAATSPYLAKLAEPNAVTSTDELASLASNEYGQSLHDEPASGDCTVCGQLLLLVAPGRDTCAACEKAGAA